MDPSDVLNPGTEEELAGIVREGSPVQVYGSGTKRHYGPSSGAPARPVCLRKLSKITAYEPGDLVVTVQAGARLVDLQAERSTRPSPKPRSAASWRPTARGRAATATAPSATTSSGRGRSAPTASSRAPAAAS
jgi:hypothetical protein